jgi:hypothetical protein
VTLSVATLHGIESWDDTRMMIWTDFDRRGRVPIEVLSPHLSGGTEE